MRSLVIALVALVVGAACSEGPRPKTHAPDPVSRLADPITEVLDPMFQRCRTSSDCNGSSSGGDCLPPGDHPSGVAPRPPPPCTPTSCPADQVCEHETCDERPCTAANATLVCPHNFECGPSNRCRRIVCTNDAQCEGACVRGECFLTTGRCGLCCPP